MLRVGDGQFHPLRRVRLGQDQLTGRASAQERQQHKGEKNRSSQHDPRTHVLRLEHLATSGGTSQALTLEILALETSFSF